MLKHCQATAADHTRKPSRRNLSSHLSDNASLNSSSGSASFNSSFGSYDFHTSHADNSSNNNAAYSDSRRSSFSSPEPLSITSRASSFASLSLEQTGPKTPIKIFAKCLRSDIEYKTLSVGYQTTCKELIWMLLAKYKMRHRDPNLFFLSMDISIKRTGIPLQRTLVLEDDARPAELKSCHPWGECKFTLQMRKGGLVRIHDSVLMAESKYKCLLIAEHTTVEEVIRILFHCYGLERVEQVDRFCVYEQCQSQCYERRLHPADRPAQVQSLWPSPSQFMFVLRRNALVAVPPPPRPAGGSASVSPVGSDVEGMDVSYSDSRSSSSSTPVSSSSPMSCTNDVSPVTPPKYFASRLHQPASYDLLSKPPRSLPALLLPSRPHFHLSGPVSTSSSIHESGLPPPPALRPKMPAVVNKQSLLMLSSNRASMGSLSSSGSRSSSASFHDYENYFYI